MVLAIKKIIVHTTIMHTAANLVIKYGKKLFSNFLNDFIFFNFSWGEKREILTKYEFHLNRFKRFSPWCEKLWKKKFSQQFRAHFFLEISAIWTFQERRRGWKMSDKGLTLYSRIRFWHVNLSFRSIHFEKFEGWTESLYTYRDRMSENLTNFQTGKSYISATSIKKSQILIFDFDKNPLNKMKFIFKKFSSYSLKLSIDCSIFIELFYSPLEQPARTQFIIFGQVSS